MFSFIHLGMAIQINVATYEITITHLDHRTKEYHTAYHDFRKIGVKYENGQALEPGEVALQLIEFTNMNGWEALKF